MALINDIYATGSVTKKELAVFTLLMNPFAPHVTEEAWEASNLGTGMVAENQWPQYDENKCKDDTVEIVVQVNGKVKAKLVVAVDMDKDTALATAKANEKIAPLIDGKTIVKEIYVPGKLVNIVAK